MGKTKTKKKVSGKKLALIITASFLACVLIAVGVFFGIGLFNKTTGVGELKNGKTIRKELPADGTLPTQVKNPLDNIGYMAYVLDNQPYYHAYSSNSTRCMGTEQITQTWKDYKSAKEAGYAKSIMLCTDLSYSSLVKSSTQTCFVGTDDAYMRSGKKPGANSVPADIEWNNSLTRYKHDDYLEDYGEFSTELSVFVLNEETIDGADECIDNGDGTYTQKFYLKPEAACWYQHGMQTRGSLKTLPDFKKLELTFTFDGKWQVLSSFCEEENKIAPAALGGTPLNGTAKTTTEFFYGAENFDNAHYSLFDSFYKDRLESALESGDKKPAQPEVLDVLGNGFREVVNAEGDGQQFSLGLSLGETDYTGKVYLKLADMSDILGSLDARVALEKKGSGKQDFYLEFKNGNINAYYSEGFALTANLSETATAVSKLASWFKGLNGGTEEQPAAVAAKKALAASEQPQDEGFDLSALLNELGFELTDTSAKITIKSENLLNIGLGVDAELNFTRKIDQDGSSLFDLENIALNSIKYNGEEILLSAEIVPDNSQKIERNISSTPANLADYINGIYYLLDSNTVKVDISLEEKLVEGLALQASAYVKLNKNIATAVEIAASYKGITAKLNAYYVLDGGWGKVYLNLTELNGQKLNAKVYCDVKDTADTVKKLLDSFNKGGSQDAPAEGGTQQSSATLAEIINKVLALDFGKIIGEVKADDKAISVSINADEILNAFGLNVGFEIGDVKLALNNTSNGLTLNGSAENLGLALTVAGSENIIEEPADKNNYVDIVSYIESVFALLNSETIKVDIELAEKLVEGLSLNATAYVKLGEQIATQVEIEAQYKEISVKLNAYYVLDGGYGKVYLNVTEFNGKQVNAKVYCDIAETVETVKKIISMFGGKSQAVALSEEQSDVLSKVLGIILSLDYNEAIKADNQTLTVKVNADALLSAFGVSFKVGEVTLSYDKATSVLSGSAPELGLGLTVSGSENTVEEPADKNNYVDVVSYIESVFAFLESSTIKVDMQLAEKLIEGLSLNATAYVKLGEQIATQVEIEAQYKEISVKLNAYYVLDGGYGKVYLNVTEFNGKAVNAKVYCDIAETVETVKNIIEMFGGNSQAAALSEEQTEEQSDVLSKVLGIILSLDYNEAIKVDNSTLTIKVNADEILSAFGVSFKVGEVTLTYDKATSVLSGSAPELGLGLTVSGSENTVEEPADKQNYVDAVDYIENLLQLITSGKYNVAISFDGSKSDIKELADIKAAINADVKFTGEDNKTIAVKLNEVKASYKTYALTLNAYYEINLNLKNYGKVYLNVTEFNGQKLDAKVYCDIAETVNAVQELIALFTKPQPETLSEEAAEAENAKITLSRVIEVLLSLDYNELINADNVSLTLTVNADEICEKLGIELKGLKLGVVTLNYNKSQSVFTGNVPALGAGIAVKQSESQIAAPEDTENYVDVTGYIESVKKLIESGKYNLTLKVDGTKQGVIKELADIKAELNADVKFTGEDNKTIAVKLNEVKVNYKEYSLTLNAYYEINLTQKTYGKVYVNLTEANGQKLNAKVYCNIDELAASVNEILKLVKKPQAALSADGGEQTDKIAAVVDVLLKLDYNTLLNADNQRFTITVNADEILNALGINFNVGTVTLTYERVAAKLSGSVSALGADMEVCESKAEIKAPDDKENYVDVADYINSAFALITSGNYHLGLAIDGTAENVLAELEGVQLSLDADVQFKGEDNKTIAVKLNEVKASYIGYSLTFNAYYEKDFNDALYGKAYIELTEVNGQKLSAKVYADISQTEILVKQLIEVVSPKIATAAEVAETQELSVLEKVINAVLKLDYNSLINADNTSLKLSVDADKIADAAGIDLKGIKLGVVTLEYNKVQSVFTGSVPALGVSLKVSGGTQQLGEPADKDNYLDVAELIKLVTSAAQQVQDIISAEDVAFNVSAKTKVNGAGVSVNGEGEVIFKQNDVTVAISLCITVDGEALNVNFLYSQIAGEEAPFVRLTLNGLGLNLCHSEINKLKESFGGLIDALTKKESAPEITEEYIAPQTAGYAMDGVAAEVLDILQNKNVKAVLAKVLGFAADLTVKLEGEGDIKGLLISYLNKATVTVGENGLLNLAFGYGENTVVTAAAEAGSGKTVEAITQELNGEGYTFYDLKGFAKQIYTWVMNGLDNELSLEGLLGSTAYTVNAKLTGSNSGIKALEGINADLTLYYNEKPANPALGSKLIKTDIVLDTGKVQVNASLSYSGRYIYAVLSQVGSLKFSDLKFRVNSDNLYGAVEQIVAIITDTNLVSLLKGEKTVEEEIQPLSEQSSDMLKEVLYAILEMDLSSSFKFDKENGTAEINIDSILEAAAGVKIGTIKVVADAEEHSLNVSVALENAESWLSLQANPAGNTQMPDIKPEDYMDISFIDTLVSDITKTATNDKNKIYTLYTYTGSVEVNIVDIIDINMNNVTLTAGLDEDGEFYFTLAASLKGKKVLFTITEEADISITYSNGYLTLGKYIGTGRESYKVITFNYLLDHLFTSDSPLRWLLGTDDIIWSNVGKAVKLNVSSGLTTPQTIELYKQQQVAADGRFSLSDYISGLKVAVNNSVLSSYKNAAAGATGKFGGNGNYYAFDINAQKLTGGVLTELYAMLTRDDETGISGIKAYGAVQSYVKFTLDLNTYREGVTETYGGKVLKEAEGVTEEAFYNDYAVFTGESFEQGKQYFVYNEETQEFVLAPTGQEGFEKEEGQTYFVKSNSVYYAEDGALAQVYDGTVKYFVYADSTAKLGEVAARNYFKYVCEKYNPDLNRTGETSNHRTPVFGCYSTENGGYDDSNVLETVELYIYDGETLERKIEARYGSTVYLISPFPEANADGSKLIYVDANGKDLGASIVLDDSILIDGKLSIYKSSVPATAVTFNFGGIINDVTAALGSEDELAEYPLNGYAFLGWYTDVGFTHRVTNVNELGEVKTVYGWYVKEQVEVNGIKYAFSADNGGFYTVTGITHESDVADYVRGDVLVFENVIKNGEREYPVIAIAENAFVGVGLKNVVVPSNIVTIGASAFKDNYGIQSVVFLADTVTFSGGNKEKDKNSIFYGCSDADGGTTTSLRVYVNNLVAGNAWKHFRRKSISTDYYIGSGNGGAVYGKGTWAYVNYAINGVPKGVELDFVNGITTDIDTISIDAVENKVYNALNQFTAESYINGYNVTVNTCLSYGITVVDIKVIENDLSERYYKFNFATAEGSLTEAIFEAEFKEYDNALYVKYGETVTVKPKQDNYEAKAINSNIDCTEQDGNLVFTMPADTVNITVVCDKKTIKSVTVKSSVAFTYNGENCDGAYNYIVENVTEGTTELAEPVALTTDGKDYWFVGWTYLDGTTLTFTDSIVRYATYYPVWAEKRDGIEVTGVINSGIINPNAENNGLTVTSDNFYKWYTDSKFAEEITSLTKDTTILYARMRYTLTASFAAQKTHLYYNVNKGEQRPDEPTRKSHNETIMDVYDKTTASQEISVFEGQIVKVSRWWTNGLIIEILNVDGSHSAHYLYFAYERSKYSHSNSKRELMQDDLHPIEFAGAGWDETINYSNVKNENNYLLFGKCEVINNISFSVEI